MFRWPDALLNQVRRVDLVGRAVVLWSALLATRVGLIVSVVFALGGGLRGRGFFGKADSELASMKASVVLFY